ncbi:hypothetical protein [Pararhizobium sp.]|uniref:hypothetical protein n=1 Tax=Pararhizobium sp. TaxID=1977563 RepID=UPI003D124167
MKAIVEQGDTLYFDGEACLVDQISDQIEKDCVTVRLRPVRGGLPKFMHIPQAQAMPETQELLAF